ncbi:hypothetical protein [Streptomyces sp. NPDC050704]|uniref:hypothetical protein n=1 Tax=Streptomyces sp. NPDC050704 TaxID=3157219 RepID=UPI00341AA417
MRIVKRTRPVRPAGLVVALGLFVVGVTGCGSETLTGAGGGDRAQQVADAWEGSDAARLWREGYFPMGEAVQLPDGAFRNEADKRAYTTQNFELRGSLPDEALKKGQVRWRDGDSLPVSVASAQAAYEKLARGGNSGPRLTVTGARLGDMAMFTSRGMAKVPAWHFTVKGYDTPLKRAAVAPSKLARSPIKALPRDKASAELSPLAGLVTVAKDGRTLTVRAEHGSCDDGPAVDVLEGEDNVVFSGWIRGVSDGPCTMDLRFKKVTVKLDRPLDDRMVLDAFTGRPVPYAAPPGSLSPTWT